MSENQGIDPLGLGLDLSTVDTSRPVLPESLYVLEVGNVEVANKKDDDTKRNLVITFKTTVDSPDATGERIISAGFQITKYYPLQQSDKEKAPDYRRDLAVLQDAMEGTKQGERPPFNPFNYIGRQVLAKVKIKPATDDFGAGNEIAKLQPVTA